MFGFWKVHSLDRKGHTSRPGVGREEYADIPGQRSACGWRATFRGIPTDYRVPFEIMPGIGEILYDRIKPLLPKEA